MPGGILISSSSNDVSYPCKNKVGGKVMGAKLI